MTAATLALRQGPWRQPLTPQTLPRFKQLRLDTDKGILGRADTDQFVKLDLDGSAVAVLGVLNQKNHEEGDDGRTGVNDKLPRVGIMKNRPREGPQKDDTHGKQKCECAARGLRRAVGNLTKQPCGPSRGWSTNSSAWATR